MGVAINEYDVYITPDNVRYDLHSLKARWVLSDEGTGMPQIEYITQRGPYQHGVTVQDYFLQPRVIQMLIRQQYCSRIKLWAGRSNILNHLRPNRQSPGQLNTGKLRKYLPDGNIRDLDVLIQEGPRFEARNLKWDEWAFQEIVRFIAFNPIYYNPTQQSQHFDSGQELTFPITFPIVFDDFTVDVNVTYNGNWEEYPRIIITGPITTPIITNVTTGEMIKFSNSGGLVLAAGETATITLTYGNKTVVKNDGTNLIGYISTDSELATFHLAPDPEATNGVNQIQVNGTSATGATAVDMYWYNRYIGV